ncbi:MAG: cysteine synthase A [Clostridiales bacterium]|nr:cysteine synthase A [Candidatus Crickella caballi]
MYYTSVEELVGNTPLIELTKVEEKLSLKAKLFAKLELFNPAGSVKDRIAYQMIVDAEKEGKISKGDTIIEPTSGNTGIGIAAIGAARGYHVVIVMPESMSIERRKLMKAYGAELVLTPASKGMAGAVEKAEELHAELGGIIAGQFVNPSNWKTHYMTTGPEIYSALDGKVDVFVAGFGTGGTITGVGKYLKENAYVKTVAVEPDASPLLSRGVAGPHKIQGIGANFIPEVLDRSVIDEIVTESIDDSLETLKMLGATEGLFVGISSGAALHAAIEQASLEENAGKNIVVLLPDGGDRYLSTLEFE